MTKAMVRALGWYLPRGIMKILFAILGLVVIPLGLLIPQDRVYRKYLGGLPVDTYLRFLLSYYQNVMYNTETKVVTYTGKALPRFLDIYNNPKDALGDKYYLDSHCRDNEYSKFLCNFIWLAIRNPVSNLFYAVKPEVGIDTSYKVKAVKGNRIDALYYGNPAGYGYSYIELENGAKGFVWQGRNKRIVIGAKLEQWLYHHDNITRIKTQGVILINEPTGITMYAKSTI